MHGSLWVIFQGMNMEFVPKIKRRINMFEFDEVIEFDEAKYEDNITRHTFPEHEGKGDDIDE